MMAAEETVGASSAEINGNMTASSAAAILLVVGEPFTTEHKDLILERITKGLKSLNVENSKCDVNSELEAVAAAAPSSEEGQTGERVIERKTDGLQLDILVNPQVQTVIAKIRSLLLTPSQHRVLAYSGHAVQGSGDWILQDDTFSFQRFISITKEADVENALKQQEGSTLDVHTIAEGEWSSNGLAKYGIGKLLKVQVNPDEVLSEFNGVVQFASYLSEFVKVKTGKELLLSSDVVGNIRFSRPTLYIFPGGQGDSALFGISGFNLLINTGYSRKACFWGFTRHLDRIDAVLMTHLGPDNLFGLSSVLDRKAQDNVHPEIGHVLMNAAVEKQKHSPNGDTTPENGGSHKEASLLVNLIEEGNKIVEHMRHLGQSPSPCFSNLSGSTLLPLNLYHKVGHGTLDMFVLNPSQDAKEMKEFFSQWHKNVNNFTAGKSALKVGGKEASIPLPNMLSICALLVWRPSSATENITRLLFPGSAPQHKLFEGLNRLKTLDIFQIASCCQKGLSTKGSKKPAGPPSKAPPTRNTAPRGAPTKPEPKKPIEKKPLDMKADKSRKEERNNKKVASTKERKSPTSSSASSTKTTTPTEAAPKEVAPVQEPVLPEASSLVQAAAPVVSMPEPEPQPEPVQESPVPLEPEVAPQEEPKVEVPSALQEAKEEPLLDFGEPSESAPQSAEADNIQAIPNSQKSNEPLLDFGEQAVAEPDVAPLETRDPFGQVATEPEPVSQDPLVDASAPEGQELLIEPEKPEVDQEPLEPPEALPEPSESVSVPESLDHPVEEIKEQSTSSVYAEPPAMRNMTEVDQSIDHAEESMPKEDEQAEAVQHEQIVLEQKEETNEESSSGMAIDSSIPSTMTDSFIGTQEELMSRSYGGEVSDEPLIPQSEPVNESLPSATEAEQQQLEDLGIYDDGAPDLVEQTPTDDVATVPNLSQQEMADLGIFSDEPESVQPQESNTNSNLQDLGIYDEPESDMLTHIESQKVHEVESVPVNGGEESTTEPEADQLVFDGAAPEGLPEPQEPETGFMESQEDINVNSAIKDQGLEEALLFEPNYKMDHSVPNQPEQENLVDDDVPEQTVQEDGVPNEPVLDELPMETEVVHNEVLESKEVDVPEKIEQSEELENYSNEDMKETIIEESKENLQETHTDEVAELHDSAPVEISDKLVVDHKEPEIASDHYKESEKNISVEGNDIDQIEAKANENMLGPDTASAGTSCSTSEEIHDIESSEIKMENQQEEETVENEMAIVDDHCGKQQENISAESDHLGQGDNQEMEMVADEEQKEIPVENEVAVPEEMEGTCNSLTEIVHGENKIEENEVDHCIAPVNVDPINNCQEDEASQDMKNDIETEEEHNTEDNENGNVAKDEEEDVADNDNIDAHSDSLEPPPIHRPEVDEEPMSQMSDGGASHDTTDSEASQVSQEYNLLEHDQPEPLPSTSPTTESFFLHEPENAQAVEVEETRTESDSVKPDSPNSPFELVDGPTDSSPVRDVHQTTNPFLGVSSDEEMSSQELTIPHSNGTMESSVGPCDSLPETSANGFDRNNETEDHLDRDSLEKEEFDPLKSWGQPMGLPAPPPPDDGAPATKRPGSATGPRTKNGPGGKPLTKPPTPRKTEAKKPTSATSPTKPATKKTATTTTTTKSASATTTRTRVTTTTKTAGKKEPVEDKAKNGAVKEPLNKKAPSASSVTAAARKTRPASAPEGPKTSPKSSATTTKRTAASTRQAPAAKSAPPTPVVPFYVDLTYVPAHGDPHYVDMEFFRRVRARYYVISALNPLPSVFTALLEAKQTWDNPDLEVTLIPTYDTDTLRHWMGLHRDQLAQLKIDVAPSASRCVIQLQEHETSCAAYRLEF